MMICVYLLPLVLCSCDLFDFIRNLGNALLPFKCIFVLPLSTEYYVIQTLRGIVVCSVTPCFVGLSVFFPSFVINVI